MTDTATAAGRRARSRKGEGRRLRDEILDATEQLLLDAGSSEAVSIRAVAEAVGVTAPSIYRHFADKATLIYEVCDRRCASLDTVMAEALEGVDDPVEGLRVIGGVYIRFGRANPEPYRLVFMNHYEDTPVRFMYERLHELASFGRALDWVEAAIEAGRFRPEHRDTTRVAFMLWAQLHGLTSLLISKPTFPWPEDREAFLDEFVTSCIRGLLADPG